MSNSRPYSASSFLLPFRSVVAPGLVPVGLLALFFASGCGRGAPVEPAAAAAVEGETAADDARDAWVLPDEMAGVYTANCAVCHGEGFEGSSLGPSLRVDPYVHGDSVDEIVATISRGVPDTKMPAWGEVLPETDIRGLAIYLLEKREGDRGDEGNGTGAPPVVPTEPIETEHHAFVLETLYDGLTEPFSIAPLPDGRILVTEKMRGLSLLEADGSKLTLVTGTPRFYDDAVLRGTAYTGSGWAHEVELHPDYAENGWIYLSYGDRCTDCDVAGAMEGMHPTMLKLVRGRLDGTRWVDQETIWEAPRETYVPGVENGSGARIAFDDEGHVFLTLGSFTDGYRGVQDMARPDGKIVRMHDDGRLPADNPFVGVPGALPSIYTLGHRNPQGLAFDPRNRQLWSTEHGPRGGDEGNLILPGRNYGWPMVSRGVDYDGRPIHYAEEYGIEYDPATLEPPVIDWTPSPGVSSLVFYRGDAFPAWRNQMIVATLAKRDLWRVEIGEDGEIHQETLIDTLGRFRDVEVAPSGELLLLLEHRSGSRVLRMRPVDGAPRG
ncbi:MAG: PQQ-dependent sugar dehydrogenase [Myxococcota bacterium]